MRNYLKDYLNYLGSILENDDISDPEAVKAELLVQIRFMQHERLIHLIVTCLFSLVLIAVIGLFTITEQIAFGILSLLIIGLLIPYVRHYYFMENSVQKMYSIYSKLCRMSETKERENL